MLPRGLSLCAVLLPLLSACTEDAEYPPAYGAYMAVVALGDVSGRLSWGPAQGQETDPFGRAAWLRQFVVGPDLQPDYMDQGIPPFCMAFRWAAGGGPQINAADAGELRISGYEAAQQFAWGVNPPPSPTDLPTQITCQHRPTTGSQDQFSYDCSLDPMVGLTGPLLTDDSRLSLSARGGANVGAFSESEIEPPAAPQLTSASFDLNQLDLRTDVVARWENTTADTMLIEIYAQVIDTAAPEQAPSEFGQVLCMEPATSGQKQIPPEALAVLPIASGSEAVMFQSVVLAASLRQSREGWGSYMVGGGRGVLGMTCRTSTGALCPAPESE